MTCENGGSCQDLVNDYMCICPNGFEGRNCSVNIDDCVNATCVNGECMDLIEDFRCVCLPGYTGSACSEIINNCLSNLCLNGGICMNEINNFTCNCMNNFTGRQCTECNSPFVIQNGTCSEPQPPPTTNICEVITPCQNGGSCVNLSNGSYSCMCPDGFSGVNCSHTPCQPNPCQNGGQCQIFNGQPNCICRLNFTGDQCEKCNIKNCLACSMTTLNLCDTCATGFMPANSSKGGCGKL